MVSRGKGKLEGREETDEESHKKKQGTKHPEVYNLKKRRLFVIFLVFVADLMGGEVSLSIHCDDHRLVANSCTHLLTDLPCTNTIIIHYQTPEERTKYPVRTTTNE